MWNTSHELDASTVKSQEQLRNCDCSGWKWEHPYPTLYMSLFMNFMFSVTVVTRQFDIRLASRECLSLSARKHVISMFPWWPEVYIAGTEAIYHSSIRLLDGRHGLLIDPGAWSNLVGQNWAHEVARKAVDHGYQPTQTKLDRPFVVQGVGSGTNDANWEIHLPIAVSDSDGSTLLHEYHAPTVGGAGKELPALLGLESTSRRNAILEMEN
jgi:hypothetical protein